VGGAVNGARLGSGSGVKSAEPSGEMGGVGICGSDAGALVATVGDAGAELPGGANFSQPPTVPAAITRTVAATVRRSVHIQFIAQ
jgi:hypothetical protein